MKKDNLGDHLAVLIDGDNVSFKVIAGLLAEVANYGTASVRRIYGDWTSPSMRGWRECLLEHSLIPIQQFAYTTGKNATDGAMIIDAMDLLYTGRFSSFCLVSSDSDFTRLAARIREQGISVYGFGNRDNTHRAFVAACNEFVYFDALPMQADEPNETPAPTMPSIPLRPAITSGAMQPDGPPCQQKPIPTGPRNPSYHQPIALPFRIQPPAPIVPGPRSLDKAALDGLRKAISSSSVYEDDFANLAEVGERLVKLSPDLNARNYGFPRLRNFVEASGIVELRMKPRGPAPPIALVRLKD